MKVILSKQLTEQTEQTKIRLNKIIEIEIYFHEEINQRKSCSKKLNKYVATFDYIDEVLIALNATRGISIMNIYYFVYKRCWCSCRNSKCKFNVFSNNRNSQIITKHNKKKKKKHD